MAVVAKELVHGKDTCHTGLKTWVLSLVEGENQLLQIVLCP